MTYGVYRDGKSNRYYLHNIKTDTVMFNMGGSYVQVQSLADYFNKELTK